MLVPDDPNELDGSENSQRVTLRWSVFDALSPEKKNILLSEETPKKILAISQQTGLSRLGAAQISIIVRLLAFGRIHGEEVRSRLATLLKNEGKDPNMASAVADIIDREIMTLTHAPEPSDEESPEEQKHSQAPTTPLPLLKALANHPKLGEQIITEGRIRVRSEAEPVRGTLRNWIRSYRDAVGIGNYDPLVRGRFIFNHDNTRRLSSLEQEKLALLFKSLEEETLLDIDPSRPAIIFPSPKPKKTSAPQPAAGLAPAFRPGTFPPPVAPLPSRPVSVPGARQTPPAQPPVAPQAPVLRIGGARQHGADAIRTEQAARYGDGAPLPTADTDEPSIRFSTDHILPSERQ